MTGIHIAIRVIAVVSVDTCIVLCVKIHCTACIQCHVRNVHLCLFSSLYHNKISDAGARTLLDALKVNTTLKSLK